MQKGGMARWVGGILVSVIPEPVHYALAVFGVIFVSTGVGRWYHGRMKRA